MAQDGVDHLVHLAGFGHEGGGGPAQVVGGETGNPQYGQAVLRLVSLQCLAQRVALDRLLLGAVGAGEDEAAVFLVFRDLARFLVLIDGLLDDLQRQGGEGDSVRFAVLRPFARVRSTICRLFRGQFSGRCATTRCQGVIFLEQMVVGYGPVRRWLLVVKVRSGAYRSGWRDFRIVPQGEISSDNSHLRFQAFFIIVNSFSR